MTPVSLPLFDSSVSAWIASRTSAAASEPKLVSSTRPMSPGSSSRFTEGIAIWARSTSTTMSSVGRSMSWGSMSLRQM